MKKLYIDKTIEIKASREKVWEVLTRRDYTNQWVSYFSPGMRVESDWQLGSLVLWKELNGKIVVEGNVTKADPTKLLRFTVFDVGMDRPLEVAEEDGITFELSGKDKRTVLHLLHGDFAAIPEGKKYYDMTVGPWENILPKIKALAEDNRKVVN